MSCKSLPSCGNPTANHRLAPGKNFSQLKEEICLAEPIDLSPCSFQSSYECAEQGDMSLQIPQRQTERSSVLPGLLRFAFPEQWSIHPSTCQPALKAQADGGQAGSGRTVNNDIQSLHQDDDDLLIAGTPAWWLLVQGVLGALDWITRGAIKGDKIKEWMLKRPRVHQALIKGQHEKVFLEFSAAKDFHEAVSIAKKMEYSKREALEQAFRYLFLTKKKLQNQDFRNVEGTKVDVFLTVKSLLNLMADGYEPVAFDNAAERVADELKMGKLPEGVYEPIAKLTALVKGLKNSGDFYEGVYIARQLGHSSDNALRYVVRFVFVLRKKMQDPDFRDRHAGWAENYLNLELLRDVVEDMQYKPEQILRAVEEVAKKELKFDRVPDEIMRLVAELNGQIPPSVIDQSITDTQRLMRIRSNQKEAKEWSMVGDVISTIVEQIKQQRGLPEGGIEARVGPYRFKLELDDVQLKRSAEGLQSESFERYIQELEGVARAIKEGEVITSRQMQIAEAIKSDPFVKKLVEVYTAPCDHMIAGSEGYQALLSMAKSDGGISKALWLIENSPHEPVGLIVSGYPIMDVLLKPPGISKGAQVSIVQPHYIGPYSFSKGTVYEVVDGKVNIYKAIIGWDQNGNRFYITDKDFRVMQQLATRVSEEVAKRPKMAEKMPSRIRAFFQFINDLWVVRKGVYKGVRLPEGLPKSINQRARLFRKVNWGRQLLQTVDQFIVELRQLPPHIRELQGEKSVQEFIRSSAELQVVKLRESFTEYFDKARVDGWYGATNILLEAMASGEASKIAEARASLERVVRDQVAAKVKRMNVADPYLGVANAGPRTIGFPKEYAAWLSEFMSLVEKGVKDPQAKFVSKLIGGRLTKRAKRFITARGLELERGEDPSLDRAAEYEKLGFDEQNDRRREHIDRAFAEYERLIVDPDISQRARMRALVGMVRLGIRAYKFHRVTAGLDALNRMASQGAELVPEAIRLVHAMAGYEEKAFPIRVPLVLKEVAGVPGKVDEINWKDVMARWDQIDLSARENINEVIRRWKLELPGSEYSIEHLKRIALANEQEFRSLLKVFHSENPIQVEQDLRGFREEVRPILERALVASVIEKQVTRPIRLRDIEAKVRVRRALEIVSDTSEFDVRMPVEMRFPYISRGRRFVNTGVGVLGPAIGGALTFLVSKDVVGWILPEPRYMLEAQAQGYTVLTTAIVADHSIHRGIDYFVSRASPYRPTVIPQAFSGWGFVGNLGAAMFTYKSIAGTMELFGMDPYWSEFTGLVGTGVVYGGWKPFVSAINPRLGAEITRSPMLIKSIEEAGGRVFVSKWGSRLVAMEKYVNGAGIVFLVTDATFGLVDGLVGDLSDPLWSQVRQEEYNLWNHNLKQSSYFSDTDQMSSLEYIRYSNIPWYEKIGNSLHRIVKVAIPDGYYRICWDISGSDWRDQRYAQLKEQTYKNGPYRMALHKLWLSADAIHKWFNHRVSNAIWKQHLSPLEGILSEWKDRPTGQDADDAVYKLLSWQSYAKANLSDEDQNWIFASGSANNGKWSDEKALAHWMQLYFHGSLNRMEDYLKDQLSIAENPIERAELAHALKNVHLYKGELSLMNIMYLGNYIDKEPPLPLIMLEN